MSRHIVFFINPISGTKKKKKLEEKITRRCSEAGMAFQILFTSAEGNYGFLPEKIKVEGISDVIICGGDGSLAPIVSAILNTEVSVGIIPSGSGNGLARTAGIPLNVDGALDIIFKGDGQLVDAIMINNHLSCHLAGLGFDAQVAHAFATRKKRGINTYIREVIKNFFSLKNYFFSIELDGKKLNEEAFCICVTNSNQFGNNFKIAPKASISDGLMDVVVFRKSMRVTALLSLGRQVFSGKIKSIHSKNLDNKKVLYFQTKEILLSNNQKAPLHIDGDPFDTEESFHLKILPQAYRLLQPGH